MLSKREFLHGPQDAFSFFFCHTWNLYKRWQKVREGQGKFIHTSLFSAEVFCFERVLDLTPNVTPILSRCLMSCRQHTRRTASKNVQLIVCLEKVRLVLVLLLAFSFTGKPMKHGVWNGSPARSLLVLETKKTKQGRRQRQQKCHKVSWVTQQC